MPGIYHRQLSEGEDGSGIEDWQHGGAPKQYSKSAQTSTHQPCSNYLVRSQFHKNECEMEGEGLCECGYKSAHPEGIFCPKCGSQLFIRRAIPRPTPAVAAEAEAWRHGHRRDRQYQDLSPRFGSVDLGARLAATGGIPSPRIASINLPAEESQIRLMFGGKLVEYARVSLVDEAVSDLTEADIPPTSPARPAVADLQVPRREGADIHADLQRQANPPIKREDSTPPFWETVPLGRVRKGRRSRSPRREEATQGVAELFPAPAPSLQPASAARSRYRPALQESTGATPQRVRRRRNFGRRQASSAKASSHAGTREPVVDNGLQLKRLTRPHHNRGQSAIRGALQQSLPPTPNGQGRGILCDGAHLQPKPLASDNQNPQCSVVNEEHSVLDAAVQQLLNEERAAVDGGSSQGNRDERLYDEQARLLVDDALLRRADTTSREAEPDNSKTNYLHHCLKPPESVRKFHLKSKMTINTCGVCGAIVVATACMQPVQIGSGRDAYQLEVDQYLEPRISTASYEAWHACRNICNVTVDRYMMGLLRMLKALQYHVVLKPLFQAAQAGNSIMAFSHKRHIGELWLEEQAELLRLTIAHHNSIEIDQKSYAISLKILNSERDAYTRRCYDAVTKIQDTLKKNREAQQSKKIRMGFSSLPITMLDVRRSGKLNFISPTDFPIPDVQRLRRDWNALDEREKEG
ncbi:hypothetical protein PV04_05840 [Phialophora macrospora]|uniref:Uncharacterized protein n=1 Tax=Phialophora macrospora TaxID=1851006 RepID=A0A0D2DWQ2_9EURO|nr:hypothetical protein PV04_05840 [Phialophora macrospora]